MPGDNFKHHSIKSELAVDQNVRCFLVWDKGLPPVAVFDALVRPIVVIEAGRAGDSLGGEGESQAEGA